MAKEKSGTKLCKYCKTDIPVGAKVCPNCRKKQGGVVKWIIIGVVVIAVLGAAFGGGSDDEKASSSGSQSNSETSKKEDVQEEVSYTAVDVGTMMNDLDSNAMKASDAYKDQYLEITGRLNVIDSSGKYISLTPADEEYAILGIQCYIKNDEQKNAVMDMAIGDTVTLRGKCTDVGEVLGYSLDIDSIN